MTKYEIWNSPSLTEEDIERLDRLHEMIEEQIRSAKTPLSQRRRDPEVLNWRWRSKGSPKPKSFFERWREAKKWGRLDKLIEEEAKAKKSDFNE